MSLVLDAGALIALDRNNRNVWAMLRIASDDAQVVQVPVAAIAQAWRNSSRQVLLTRALRHCEEITLDAPAARAAGLLCGRSGTADIIDASVALTAAGLGRRRPVSVLTSDPDGLRHLLAILRADVNIVEV